ncbi:MAG: phosphatidate cytidylyltransferase [Neisseria sp.]|nr:phosphatidate cytidylyltransferase [Neisseria sp.]
MLKQRIITALVLLPIMLGMLFGAPPALWSAFCGLIALLALWEYSRLCGISGRERAPYLIGTAVFMLLAQTGGWMLPAPGWWAVLAFWALVMPLWLKYKWKLNGGWPAYAAGWLLMLPFWFALTSLRPHASQAWPLLSVMALVWVADVGAYFFGRAYGRHKLAPAISPGKSWEGVFGGAACVLVYVLIISMTPAALPMPRYAALPAALLLTAVSVCGDLLESWLKRAAGVKDSSRLLPGHGGVFDRVDSLIAVLSVYAAIAFLSA